MTQLALPISAAINVPPKVSDLVSIHVTYSTYTEESVQWGGSEDNGFCDESGNAITDNSDDLQNLSDETNAMIELYSKASVSDGWTGLVDLVESLLGLSFYEPYSYPMVIRDTDTKFSFSGDASEPDFQTGEYQCFDVHFDIKNNDVLKLLCSIFENNKMTERQKQQLDNFEINLWSTVYGTELKTLHD